MSYSKQLLIPHPDERGIFQGGVQYSMGSMKTFLVPAVRFSNRTLRCSRSFLVALCFCVLGLGIRLSAVEWWDDDSCYSEYQSDTQQINDGYNRAFRAMTAHYEVVQGLLKSKDDGLALLRLDSWLRETSFTLYLWYQDSLDRANERYEECRDDE